MGRKIDAEGTKLRKEQILKAAGKCFAKTGFHKTSMQEICKKAKLSPGTVYHYFKSKEDIILYFAEREFLQTQEFVDDIQKAENLDSYLGAIIDGVLGARDVEDLQVYLEVFTEAGRNKKVGRLLEKADNLAFKSVKKKIKQLGVKDGRASIDSLALFICYQIEALELFKLDAPSRTALLEMAEMSKTAMLHVIGSN